MKTEENVFAEVKPKTIDDKIEILQELLMDAIKEKQAQSPHTHCDAFGCESTEHGEIEVSWAIRNSEAIEEIHTDTKETLLNKKAHEILALLKGWTVGDLKRVFQWAENIAADSTTINAQ